MVEFKFPAYQVYEASPSYDQEISLKNPVQFDSDSIPIEMNTYRTRDGNVSTVIDKPRQQNILTNLSFESINRFQVEEIKSFLENSQGEYILYVDYESNQWICKIIDTDVRIVEVRGNWLVPDSPNPYDPFCGKMPSFYDFTLVLRRWKV